MINFPGLFCQSLINNIISACSEKYFTTKTKNEKIVDDDDDGDDDDDDDDDYNASLFWESCADTIYPGNVVGHKGWIVNTGSHFIHLVDSYC